jgi:DNA-directed RNA polymerase subunit E'/Rpb7
MFVLETKLIEGFYKKLYKYILSNILAKMDKSKQPKQPSSGSPSFNAFMRSLLTMKVHLKISEVGRNTKQNLESKIKEKIEGKCIAEGYVRPNSVQIVRYSSGNILNEFVEFQVVYECVICCPSPEMSVTGVVTSITKAGIQAEVRTPDGYVPIIVSVARDHNYSNKYFSEITEGQTIQIKIRGTRYELNDPCIYAIGTLFNPNKTTKKPISIQQGEYEPEEEEEEEPNENE